MVDYSFDEKKELIDKQGFEVLARYFSIRKDVAERKHTNHLFEWGNGWDTLKALSPHELCTLSVFLFSYGSAAFTANRDNLELKNKCSSEGLLKLLEEKMIDKKMFLELAGELELKVLGDETMQIIAAIANDLNSKDFFKETNHAANWYPIFRERFVNNNELIQKYNGGRRKPFYLETTLSFDHTPVCLRFSEDGKLYVLDSESILHEFIGREKSNEFPLFTRHKLPSMQGGFIGDTTALPNISIAGKYLFLTTGGYEIARYNLEETQKFEGKIIPDHSHYDNRFIFHDIVIKEGNVLISISDDKREQDFHNNERYIGRVIIQEQESDGNIRIEEIYRGRFPTSFTHNSLDDYTLRMDVHNGQLYFPRGAGISLYRGKEPDGKKPKEMIAAYKREIEWYDSVSPIMKFGFGNDFMVAQARLKGFDIPMLCFFRAEYDATESTELAPLGIIAPPSRLKLDYITYPPKITGQTLTNASLAAHENRFAITHSSLNKVVIYSVTQFV